MLIPMIEKPELKLHSSLWIAVLLTAHSVIAVPQATAGETARTIVINFDHPLGRVEPRAGFLGGLRDATPDAIIQPLHPSLWRIGHQFRGRISTGLPGAIARVESLGAAYKLVMSDLIRSQTTDWASYEADVKKLVAQSVVWLRIR